MESTDAKAASVQYKTNWLRFRHDRSITPDRLWMFTDGSTSGWHAAILVDTSGSVKEYARFIKMTSNRNVGAELNGLLLGLEKIEEYKTVTVVHDYVGVGAWTIGAWEAKKPEVIEAIAMIRKLIYDKKLEITFIHHGGHQDKIKGTRPICHSDFTIYNCKVDKLCDDKVEVGLS